jgi:hypothetical protein
VKFVLENLVVAGVICQISAPECPLTGRRYERTDSRIVEGLRQRIRQIVLSTNALSYPRGVVLLGLVEACPLTSQLFSPKESSASGERLHQLAGLALLSRTMFAAVRSFRAAPCAQIAAWLIGTRYKTRRA